MIKFLFVAMIYVFSSMSVMASSVAAQKIFDDAIAYWGMRSLDDASGHNSRLKVYGASAKFNVALKGDELEESLRVGGDGRVVRLNDTALSAGLGADGEMTIRGEQMTIAMRLKNTTNNWEVTLASKHGGHDILQYNIFGFDMPGDTGARIGFEIGTKKYGFGENAIISEARANQWCTIIGRYDGRVFEMYFNGRRVVSNKASGIMRPESGQPFIIGGEKPNGGEVFRKFTGMIDHVALWDRAISDEEIVLLSGADAEPLYKEKYRPQFHFTPQKNWSNDPNGLLFANGKYHLFYQHNPFGPRWGHMSWGHAVSKDMLHWEHKPVALEREEGVMMFSGSAVNDRNNTSGFGQGKNGPLVAIYTAVAEHSDPMKIRQTQDIAYSNDDGETWTKYVGNPVVDRKSHDFRDPKVFWFEPEKKWVMVVALPGKIRVLFYESYDLKNWNLMSEFGPSEAHDTAAWECPELIELPVDGDEEDTRWVLQVSVGISASGGTGGRYFVGQFDGKQFINENPHHQKLWVDYGRDFYALQSFNGTVENDGRTIWLGWINNLAYLNDLPTNPWRGAMSIPREVSLVTTPDGIRLVQKPIRELVELRGAPVVSLINEKLIPGVDPLDQYDVRGQSLDIVATFWPGNATRFGLKVLEGDHECTVVGFDTIRGGMFIDRGRSGVTGFTSNFGNWQWVPMKLHSDGRVTMRILVDHSVVEVFGGDGEIVMTDRVFPKKASAGISLFSEHGEAVVESLRIYPMSSVWE